VALQRKGVKPSGFAKAMESIRKSREIAKESLPARVDAALKGFI